MAPDLSGVHVSDRVEVETVTVGRGGRRGLRADLYRPPSPNGVGILLIHGGSFVSGDRHQLRGYGIALGRKGYTCLACEYRLAGEAPWPAQIDDVQTALTYLHDRAHHWRWILGKSSPRATLPEDVWPCWRPHHGRVR